MEAATFLALTLSCAPAVHVSTAHALVQVESSLNPWAVGVVGGELERQPQTRAEAIATARTLQSQGWNFSVGLGQVNVRNFTALGLTIDSAFEPCANLRAMQAILSDCFKRASASGSGPPHAALRRALSCYYSGNFTTGFTHGYVRKVARAAAHAGNPSPSPTSSKE